VHVVEERLARRRLERRSGFKARPVGRVKGTANACIGEEPTMNERVIMRRPRALRTSAGSVARRERRETPVFLPPADAPVLHGSSAPVRVATAEHHDPKTYS
jgi:hypothetical protein